MLQKKKIVGEDSSDFEPDEPVTLCKKAGGGGAARSGPNAKTAKPALAEKENEPVASQSNTRRSLRIQTMKKKEPDPGFDIFSEGVPSGYGSSEVDLPSNEDTDDDFLKTQQGRNRRRQAALKSKANCLITVMIDWCVGSVCQASPSVLLLGLSVSVSVLLLGASWCVCPAAWG